MQLVKFQPFPLLNSSTYVLISYIDLVSPGVLLQTSFGVQILIFAGLWFLFFLNIVTFTAQSFLPGSALSLSDVVFPKNALFLPHKTLGVRQLFQRKLFAESLSLSFSFLSFLFFFPFLGLHFKLYPLKFIQINSTMLFSEFY